MSEAMPLSEAVTAEEMQPEIAFLADKLESPPLFRDPMSASEAAAKVKAFTETWPDPFVPGFQWANPWAQKKENKGKKERPPGQQIKPTTFQASLNA